MRKILLLCAVLSTITPITFTVPTEAVAGPDDCSPLPQGYVRDGKGTCGNLLAVNADGSINVSGGGGGGGGAVTVADGADVTQGAKADAAATDSTSSWSVAALLKGLYNRSAAGVTALGSPFQAGGSIGNTAFGISGTLPSFASTQTFNLGTLNGAATAANQTTMNTTLGSPFQAGGSIGNTGFNVTGTLPVFAAVPAFKVDQTTPGTTNLVAAGQNGTWTVQPGNTANTTAWKVDGSAVTQPVSGTLTANIGTVGTLATAANQTSEQAPVTPATATATTAVLTGCTYVSAGVTFTTAQQGASQCSSKGELLVQPSSGGVPAIFLADNSDVVAGSSTIGSQKVVSRGTLLGASNWERARTVVNAANTTGTGIAASGLMAQGDDAAITATTEGSFGNLRMDLVNHALIVRPFESNANSWTYSAASGGISNTTTAVTVKAAAGAGLRNCLTGVQVSTTTLGAGTELAFRDGAAGTVVWRGFLSTTAGTATFSMPTPICGTAATLLEVVTLTATVTGSVYVNAQGYIAP